MPSYSFLFKHQGSWRKQAMRSYSEAVKPYVSRRNGADEIFRKVLTQDRVDNYSSADAAKKAEIQKQVAEEILKTYSWGLTRFVRNAENFYRLSNKPKTR